MAHDHPDHGGSTGHGHEGAFDSAAMVDMLDAEAELSAPLIGQAMAAAEDLLEARQVPVSRLLDLGCGPGVATTALAEVFPGAAVVAADASATMLARVEDRARQAGCGPRVETRQVDMNDDLEPLGRFELVWAAMSLHHVDDEVVTLRRVRERLAPLGVLCVLERAAPTSVGWDDDLGRPGLSDRLEAAWGRWFEARRAHLPGAANADRYPEMLAAAGLEVASARTMTVGVPAPDRESVERFVGDLVERSVVQLEGAVDPADLTALSTWIDERRASSAGVPAGIEVRMSRQLFLAVGST